MKHSKKVITASPGLSGAGLIFDYLLSRKDFVSPFKKYPDQDQQAEFRFVTDPGGLNSLYNGFYKNFSINNSAYVFDEFNKYLKKLKKLSIKKNKKKIYLYNSNFFKEADKFKKKIVKLSYYGLPQFHRLGLSKKDRIIWRIFNKYKSAQETKFLKMVIPVSEKKFIKEAKNFIDRYLKSTSKKKKIKYIIDQGVNFWSPLNTSKFFSNCKIILVTRDPRSVFSSMKIRKSMSFPSHNLNVFIKWYASIMEEFDKIKKNSKILKIIRYERFILNHKSEKKKLLKFLNLKDEKSNNYNIEKSKKNIYKAKYNLSKKELTKIENKLSKYLQWPV